MNKLFLPCPYPEANKTLSFYQTDSEELYERNKNRFGKEWIWYDRSFTYVFNSQSFRMNKEIDDINFDNYCVFFGCSFTMGHGLPVEETFAYKVASNLNTDYINAGVGGASPKYVADNLIKFLSNVDKKPKLVIINWPNLFRTYYQDSESIVFKIPEINQKDKWYDDYKDFLIDEKVVDNFIKLRNMCKEICRSKKLLYYDFTQALVYRDYVNKITDLNIYDKVNKLPLSHMDRVNFQFARDVGETYASHFGIGINDTVTDEILNWYQKQLNT